MKLPTLPFFEKKPQIEYFLALVLRDDKINAFIFEQKDTVIKIVNSQEEAFTDSLDKTSYEDLLDAADKVISQAEDELDLPQEVQKTIFGLKESWVKDAKIKKENLDILKKLSDSLGLVPIGFLTISEAVVSLLQKEEGAPPTAIFVDVGKNLVTVSSVRAGKVVEVKTAEIHQTPVFTVDTLLKHFEVVEILPSKVVLLNEDEELVQEFISHQWSKSLPFLHLPQIVSLQADAIGKAFVIGIANQTGAKVLDEFEEEDKEIPREENVEAVESIEIEEKIEIVPGIEQESEPVAEPEPVTNVEYVDSSDFFGFVKGKDVAKEEPKAQVFEEIPEDVALKETQKQLLPAGLLVVLPKIKTFVFELLGRAKNLISKIPFEKIPIRNRGILYLAIPLILILLFLIYYFFFLKANVILSVKPKVVEKSQDISFSTTSSDFKNNIVKGSFVSVSEDGTETTPATGQKETGDQAKGTITIFNSSTQTITYPVQTKITSSNGLNFLTLGSVTVASRSSDTTGSGNPAGTNTVNVQAEKFGTEYNLPSGTKFPSIGGNSDIAAKNDNPFSGGTKKQIQVVSKDDLDKVQNDLTKQLEDKARSDIKNKLTADLDILPNFIDESLDKKSFDKDADSEAKSVTLTGTISYQTLSYNRDEFINYLKTIFGQNQSIDKNNLELSFDSLKKNNDSDASAKMNVKVKIIPVIDANIVKQIAGESFTKARNQLMNIPQVVNVEIKFSPNFEFLPKTLPRINKNIKITILQNG